MMSAVIIDDMQKNVSLLSSFLQAYCPEVCLLGTANNARDGRALIISEKPQLVFLDIEMPFGSGFDLLKSMPSIDFEVIFITAFNQYALNAFRFSALDYLLKPVNISQLKEAVGRAERRINEKTSMQNYELLLSNLDEKKPERQRIVLLNKGQQFHVLLEDIMYCVADGSYTHVTTKTQTFVSSKNLKDFEDMLPTDVFFRIHYSHIVNKNFILSVGKNDRVIMKDNAEFEIAVRRKSKFLKDLR